MAARDADVQIAARIASGQVNSVFFLVDPLDKHAHDPAIQLIHRVCNVHDVPLATNVATANLTLSADAFGPRATHDSPQSAHER